MRRYQSKNTFVLEWTILRTCRVVHVCTRERERACGLPQLSWNDLAYLAVRSEGLEGESNTREQSTSAAWDHNGIEMRHLLGNLKAAGARTRDHGLVIEAIDVSNGFKKCVCVCSDMTGHGLPLTVHRNLAVLVRGHAIVLF